MQLIVNAKPQVVSSDTLSDALVELGFTHAAIATAVNGQFVPAPERATTRLSAGDRLEVLAPMQGG